MVMRWLLAILVCGVLGCSAESAPKETCGVHHLDLTHQDHDHKKLEALAEGARHRHGVYMATLAVGTPAQDFNVIIDTGSANLVVMGTDCAGCTGVDYRSADSSTAQDTSADFSLQYGSASLVAKVVKDLTGLPCGERVEVVFGHATEVAHLPASILGLAYAALAAPVSAPVQPWLDAMVKAGVLDDLFSLRLCGPGKSGSHLKLGGVDSSVDLDGVEYTPVVEERYYAVAPPTFTVDGTSIGAGSATTIIDSGTTLVLVPYGVHEAFVTKLKAVATAAGLADKIPDGVWTSSATDISARAKLSTAEVAKFPPMVLRFAGEGGTFEQRLSPQRYFRRTSSGDVFLGVRPGQGMTILGQVFMEGRHVIFDRAQKRVGFVTATECDG